MTLVLTLHCSFIKSLTRSNRGESNFAMKISNRKSRPIVEWFSFDGKDAEFDYVDSFLQTCEINGSINILIEQVQENSRKTMAQKQFSHSFFTKNIKDEKGFLRKNHQSTVELEVKVQSKFMMRLIFKVVYQDSFRTLGPKKRESVILDERSLNPLKMSTVSAMPRFHPSRDEMERERKKKEEKIERWNFFKLWTPCVECEQPYDDDLNQISFQVTAQTKRRKKIKRVSIGERTTDNCPESPGFFNQNLFKESRFKTPQRMYQSRAFSIYQRGSS